MELKSCELPLRLLPMLTKTQNDPKSAKTNRNKPKRPKKNCKTIESKTYCPNAQIWLFWAKKYQLSILSRKFRMFPVSNVLISSLTLVLKIFRANPWIWTFFVKKYQLFNLNKILPVPDFESADFKFDLLNLQVRAFLSRKY